MVSLKLSALFVGLLAVVQASVPSKRQDGCSLASAFECAFALPSVIPANQVGNVSTCLSDAVFSEPLPNLPSGIISCTSGQCITTTLPKACSCINVTLSGCPTLPRA
ncbi:hypothetical protein M422DRAFT_55358 [Sphaerobolus stellatus SS14]|uniref:Unplaced genomic scaffold SPHSTscaffold_282, whole genome shotgun sequence n=1 Tax=Sphaerobolus stellatus (strain SS14) TaxID=990650 RepID=A0A0C9UCA5_SPHS4|nr:hypothetical protein M422DRAFT_55358 [Sphaerobolus stellatus SS14]